MKNKPYLQLYFEHGAMSRAFLRDGLDGFGIKEGSRGKEREGVGKRERAGKRSEKCKEKNKETKKQKKGLDNEKQM
ncbi:MAG: hypothetical protein IKM53_05820 [Clostridia bacterium]|nr:hypothetical protein [Clostridia bacterium]